MSRALRLTAIALPIFLAFLLGVTLAWLRWDAHQPLNDWFDTRHGSLFRFDILESSRAGTQQSDLIQLRSTSGLEVTLRAIRNADSVEPLPVLLILGGHRTGSDAAKLFGDVGHRAVVALDYPYDGEDKVKGLLPIAKTIPVARQALRDTPPAVSLTVDWLSAQSWVDQEQLVIVGASLGVPFAALAASRDERISGALLVHGAADNELWIKTQIERRIDSKIMHAPLAKLLYWLSYGPTFDTATNIALLAPKPVVVIGATHDERTPEGQTESLFSAAGQPKWLRWTDGAHIQPGRTRIVDDLLSIADDMLPFPPQSDK